MDQQRLNNRLLCSLSPADFEMVAPHLTERRVDAGAVLFEPGADVSDAYFPESGIVSFAFPTAAVTEIGIAGREGMVGASILLGVRRNSLWVTGQIRGAGCCIPSAVLLAVAEARPSVREVFLRYIHAFTFQCASTAYANAQLTVERRLARWLLMTHDRVDGDELRLTHEYVAIMLGVRRPGVTEAIHVLEGIHAIRSSRGRIVILDRAKLRQRAGDTYGTAEAEYEAIIGPLKKNVRQTTVVGKSLQPALS